MNGRLIALSRDDAKRLFVCKSDDQLRELMAELIDAKDQLSCDCGVEWRELQESLGDQPPLNQCLLGGRALHGGDDLIVHLVRPDFVPHIAAALESEPFDTDERLDLMRSFYRQAADRGDAAVFFASS